MSNLLERPVSIQRGWDYLRSLEFPLRVPRPEHDLADPDVQQAWKKNSINKCNKLDENTHKQQ
ncbi:MAG: winged helix-turn-helix domain-containing protein [Nostoc sp. ChiSLP02]|nr:winged helix-turn-helix domain-containing protein [Nostoc sp. DedSLP05]MDZ8100076.1 winged helix-turn-helix domain-containing protein [Nostoc sp. DedSLP01]MDZ8186633.1 winged helix-turn-helix domain-containing protein [Nostoc sp. ChiSLP02]